MNEEQIEKLTDMIRNLVNEQTLEMTSDEEDGLCIAENALQDVLSEVKMRLSETEKFDLEDDFDDE